MKLLTYTTLYPNAAQPNHAVFVENRLTHLVRNSEAETRIIAPVPWFPFRGPRFGEYGKYADVPHREQRHGLTIFHPRFPVIPKMGMHLAPELLYRATMGVVRRNLRDHGDVDILDAHYFYPDGVAAARIAQQLQKPLVITARGTDINLIPDYPGPRKKILKAAAQAAGIVTVCAALKDRLVELGATADKIHVLRNGVDLELFTPAAKAERSPSDPFVLLSVGLLIPRKGHDLIVKALPGLPNVHLHIAGDGPERRALLQLAEALGVADRVKLFGQIPHRELPALYRAADILVLASDREGWPNVLLEAMACGTPVAATKIWGTPEVVTCRQAGQLIDARTPDAIAATVAAMLDDLPDRSETRRYAEQFSWQQTTDGLFRLFSDICAGQRVRP